MTEKEYKHIKELATKAAGIANKRNLFDWQEFIDDNRCIGEQSRRPPTQRDIIISQGGYYKMSSIRVSIFLHDRCNYPNHAWNAEIRNPRTFFNGWPFRVATICAVGGNPTEALNRFIELLETADEERLVRT